MNNKIEKIEKLIDKIIKNAIKNYEGKFDETKGMSIEDWENGYKGVIYGYDGKILSYISINDFKSLYNNFKYELSKATNKQLNNIIKYLEEQSKYNSYNDLDKEDFWLEDFN